MKKIILATSLLTACVAFANPYGKCIACHGPAGEKVGMSPVAINTLTKEQFVSALKGYKDGTYGGAKKVLMINQVKNMDEATMQAIADKIAK